MDPTALEHWPWNQKTETQCPQDIANSEIYQKFFRNEQSVTLEIPKCIDGFTWTGIRFATTQPDSLIWYPLGIVVPLAEEPLLHTIFIHYGEWNILPISITPEFIEKRGHPLIKMEFPSEVSGKIELLAQKPFT